LYGERSSEKGQPSAYTLVNWLGTIEKATDHQFNSQLLQGRLGLLAKLPVGHLHGLEHQLLVQRLFIGVYFAQLSKSNSLMKPSLVSLGESRRGLGPGGELQHARTDLV